MGGPHWLGLEEAVFATASIVLIGFRRQRHGVPKKSVGMNGLLQHVMLIFDRMPLDGGSTGKEHIGRTTVRMHRALVDYLSIFPIGDAGLCETALRESFQDFSNQERVSIIDRGRARPTSSIHFFLLRSCLHIPRGVRDFLSFWRNYSCYARALADLGASFEEFGKPTILTVSIWGHSKTGKMALYASELYRIPYVIWEHRSNYQRFLLSEKSSPEWLFVLAQADGIAAVSPQLIENMKQSFPSISEKVFDVIPNPVEEGARIESAFETKAVKDFAGDRFVFAGVENWSRQLKRLDVLLEAFRSLLDDDMAICLVLAGNYPKWLSVYISENCLDEDILVLGKVAHERMKGLYVSIDCCVISSDHETFGNPAVEALSYGKPVVATRSGGPESIITDQSLGRIVEPADPRGLAEAMSEVFALRGTFKPSEISEYCRSRFGSSAVAGYWNNLYRRISNLDSGNFRRTS